MRAEAATCTAWVIYGRAASTRRRDVMSQMRRLGLAAALLVILLLGSAGAVWFRLFYEPDRPLEPGWDAVVVTIAGGGVPGYTPATPFGIRFADPFGIAAAADGTIYVADGVGGHRIYRIASAGVVTVLAGADEGFTDGQGAHARFSAPSGIALDPDGNLVVADTGNDAIRRVTPEGIVTTIAGIGAGLNGPVGVAVDSRGRII